MAWFIALAKFYCPFLVTRRDVAENTKSTQGGRQQHKTSKRVSFLAWNATSNQEKNAFHVDFGPNALIS